MESRLIHTVTGEDFPLPLSTIPDVEEDPAKVEFWPFYNRYDLRQFLPSEKLINDSVEGWWGDMLGCMAGAVDGLLRRPAPEED